MWAIDRHDRWRCMSSAQQGSVVSTLRASRDAAAGAARSNHGDTAERARGSGAVGSARSLTRRGAPGPLPQEGPPHPVRPPTGATPIHRSAACHWPHGTACGRMCPQDPFGPRTVSPQPVSSTRRRLSTDEMQLREVGKLAVHLWKMQWLQKPGPRAPLGPVRPQRSDLSVGTPPGVLRGRVSAARTVCRARRLSLRRGNPGPGPRPVPADHPGGSAVAHVELLLCRGI